MRIIGSLIFFFLIAYSVLGQSGQSEAILCSIPHAPKGGIKLSLIPQGAGFDFKIEDHVSNINQAPIRDVEVSATTVGDTRCRLTIRGQQGDHRISTNINFQIPNASKKIQSTITGVVSGDGGGGLPAFECTLGDAYQNLASSCAFPDTSSSATDSISSAPVSTTTSRLTSRASTGGNDEFMKCDSTASGGGYFHFTAYTNDDSKTASIHLQFVHNSGRTEDRGSRSIKIDGSGCNVEMHEVNGEKGDKFAVKFKNSDFGDDGTGKIHLSSGASSLGGTGSKWTQSYFDYTCTESDAWPAHFSDCKFVWPAPGSSTEILQRSH